MRSLSLSVVALVFVGCQFSASCGGRRLNMEKLKDWLSTRFEGDIKQKPSNISCPDSVKLEKDKTFDCTVSFGTVDATVTIKQIDDKGNVTTDNLTGILIGHKLEKLLADEVRAKLNVDVTVNCGDRVRASKAGDTFTCEGKDAKGAGGTFAITVKDNRGNVDWKLVNPNAATPPAPAGSAASGPAPTAETPPAPAPTPTPETPPAP